MKIAIIEINCPKTTLINKFGLLLVDFVATIHILITKNDQIFDRKLITIRLDGLNKPG